MAHDPFSGDVLPLERQLSFRRRVGDWRILTVNVTDIVRRTTTTYRKR